MDNDMLMRAAKWGCPMTLYAYRYVWQSNWVFWPVFFSFLSLCLWWSVPVSRPTQFFECVWICIQCFCPWVATPASLSTILFLFPPFSSLSFPIAVNVTLSSFPFPVVILCYPFRCFSWLLLSLTIDWMTYKQWYAELNSKLKHSDWVE